MLQHSWLSPGIEVRPAGAKGDGLFALRAFEPGEIVSGFGGHVMHRQQFVQLPVERQVHSLQISETLFMVTPERPEPADHFNHSCEPNLGVTGNVLLEVIRAVAPGDELTFDYAMCDADPYDEFECGCLAPSCRGKVTGNDWMLPELQARYRGYFSTYLERRIASLIAGDTSDAF